jgi:hypothetical protein
MWARLLDARVSVRHARAWLLEWSVSALNGRSVFVDMSTRVAKRGDIRSYTRALAT